MGRSFPEKVKGTLTENPPPRWRWKMRHLKVEALYCEGHQRYSAEGEIKTEVPAPRLVLRLKTYARYLKPSALASLPYVLSAIRLAKPLS